MNLDYLSQLVSMVSLGTLGFITLMLARKSKVHIFIIVGQDVFAWLTATLATILFTRVLVLMHLFTQTSSRTVNSLVFTVSVLGILWSVTRHAKHN